MRARDKMNFEYIILDISELKYNNEEIKEKSLINMKVGISRYIQLGNKSVKNGFCGESAIAELLSDLSGMFNNRVDIKEIMLEVNYQMKIFGFITSKRYILEKIKSLNLKNDIIDRYKEVISIWNKICMLLLKCGFSNNKDLYTSILERAEKNIENEREILSQILLCI